MGQFIKSDKMAASMSAYHLLKFDVPAKENHNVYSKTDAGFRAESNWQRGNAIQAGMQRFLGGDCEKDHG